MCIRRVGDRIVLLCMYCARNAFSFCFHGDHIESAFFFYVQLTSWCYAMELPIERIFSLFLFSFCAVACECEEVGRFYEAVVSGWNAFETYG